jgi:hypothetical protein
MSVMSLKKPKITTKATEDGQSQNTLDKFFKIEAQPTPSKQQSAMIEEIQYKTDSKTQKKKRNDDFDAFDQKSIDEHIKLEEDNLLNKSFTNMNLSESNNQDLESKLEAVDNKVESEVAKGQEMIKKDISASKSKENGSMYKVIDPAELIKEKSSKVL